jgi:hypothetical protein
MTTTLSPAGVLSDGTTIDALTMLQRVADRDISGDLLDWLCKRLPSGDVQAVALRTLTTCSSTDLADRVFGKPEYLRYFSTPGLKRSSAQVGLRSLVFGQPLSAEPPTDVPFTPAELFFRDLLRPDVLGNANRLVDHREDADISRALAALLESAFSGQSEAVLQFMLQRLASSDETQGILTSTLRVIPEFQRRMRPQMEHMLGRLGGEANPEAVHRLRTSMEAAVQTPRPSLPDASVLANLWKTGPVTPNTLGGITGLGAAERPRSPQLHMRFARSTGSVLRLISGVAMFLIAAFAFNGDIPTGASIGTRLTSRGLSFLAAFVTAAALGYVYRTSTQQLIDRKKPFAVGTNVAGDTFRQNIPLLALFGAYAIYDAHRRYVGPLHFWNQALVFVLNAVGLMLLARAADLDITD